MLYREFRPSKALEGYIRCYYLLECNRATLLEDQAVATGCIEVMFTLNGSQWQIRKGNAFVTTSTVELWGQILQPLSFRAVGPGKVFGIRFHPATASLLLHEDLSRFNDEVTELSCVVGKSINELLVQLQEAPSETLQIELVEAYLIKRLIAHRKIHKIELVKEVLRELTRDDFFDNISNIAARYGVTARHLQKVFLQATGLTPKLHTRINRFQKSLAYLGRRDSSFTDIAYQCGYFDQSHFIREFKEFTGMTPSRFASGS